MASRGRAQFDVNLFGGDPRFVPFMRERSEGRVVNVPRGALGRFVLPGSGLYSASKFAVEAVSDALRMELEPFGLQNPFGIEAQRRALRAR